MFVSLYLLAVAPVAATQAAPTADGPHSATAKIECRMVQEPGSRIPTKVCRLDKEWDALAKDAQADMNSSRNKSLGANSPQSY